MSNKLEITLKRSVIGAKEDQKRTIQTLGLKKIRQSIVHDDSDSLRGMINKVSHLVTVKEI
ncbi:MAG TPA: 50S ribosomal protein L30 [Candidatus Avamphibacillus intestinigallinarum]|nr:50S ribosomal protein L30 [Candidatus Avamphibacillus intestinigallinarum]